MAAGENYNKGIFIFLKVIEISKFKFNFEWVQLRKCDVCEICFNFSFCKFRYKFIQHEHILNRIKDHPLKSGVVHA